MKAAIAFLQMVLAGPGFHAHILAQSPAFLDGAERILLAAWQANEIRLCEIKELAPTSRPLSAPRNRLH